MSDRYYLTSEFTFVWDEEKNQNNIRKHGISFETAALVFNDDLRLEFPDVEHSKGEERYNTIGLMEVQNEQYRENPNISHARVQRA